MVGFWGGGVGCVLRSLDIGRGENSLLFLWLIGSGRFLGRLKMEIL